MFTHLIKLAKKEKKGGKKKVLVFFKNQNEITFSPCQKMCHVTFIILLRAISTNPIFKS